ncbi:MAG: exopolyphosphatase [Cyclobacteriaceae bacterium]|nr:exopolyphosphatase [Cyclobacteriaceae bacterium]
MAARLFCTISRTNNPVIFALLKINRVKAAIIDLGTNTFHLLIAQRKGRAFEFIHRERVAVRLGQKGINQGTIRPDALERAVKALQGFKETIDYIQVDTIMAFGTSALRNAANVLDVLKEFEEKAGITVEVITGDKEAELIYEGVRYGMDLGDEMSLIMDIGGGSVEFIIGNDDGIAWKKSFEIGAQRLLEQFQHNDPFLASEQELLDVYLTEKLKPLYSAIEELQPKTLVGSSGTFDTLSDIYCIKHDLFKRAEDAETPLTVTGFYEVFEELLVKNRADRMLIPGMIEMRVDMIVVACCLIEHILKRYQFNNIRVSTYALKEGILNSLLSKVTI